MSEKARMDFTRRKLLITAANPAQRLDYVITIARKLSLGSGAGEAALALRYIPDRLILDQAAIAAYMRALEQLAGTGLEALAHTLLDDISNELVPRWVEVNLTQTAAPTDAPGTFYTVTMEDRQPNWSNPQVLSRLKPWEQT